MDLYLRKGARAKEGLLTRLMNTPSPLWLLGTVLRPRFGDFVLRRRKEFSTILRNKLYAVS